MAPFLYFTLLVSVASGQVSSWEVGGEYEIRLDYRKNFALGEGKRDDLFLLDQELQVRWAYEYDDWFSAMLEGKLIGEHQLYTGGGGRKSDFDPERGETWVRFARIFGHDLSFKVGHQNFEEARKWWWDDDLDAVAIRYRNYPLFFEVGVAQELLPVSLRDSYVDPDNKGVLRILSRANWYYFGEHALGLFTLYQNDNSKTQSVGTVVKTDQEDPSDATLWWGGIRAVGTQPLGKYGEFSYWNDVAIVLGREKLLQFDNAGHGRQVVTSRRDQGVHGWAIDVGYRWDAPFFLRPSFILGYARGSGDKKPDSGTDYSFRQTGLQANDEEFRTYGELLRPELSNLSIPALAVQVPVFARSYIEFAYRHFRQVYAVPFLRDARIEADPDGIHKNIGQEWMLYSLVREWKNIEIEFVGAAFKAGNAYGTKAGRMAYSLFTQITYEF